MPKISIMDRLKTGECLLMDGGTGSELQRRGVDVLKSASEHLKAWSATANIDAAGVVQQVHEQYLRGGADIIISNNFWTCPSRLAQIGLGDRWREYARAAGEIALKARSAINPEAYVAGGIAAPTLGGAQPDLVAMGEEAFKREIGNHATLLADIGVDVILFEYVGYIADCVAGVDACAETGLPVFLAVRHIQSDGLMQYGEKLGDLGAALTGHKVDAILLHCSQPEAISAGVPFLQGAFDGPIGAYPNIGYHPTSKNFLQNSSYPPARLVEFAQHWKAMGVQIIGGCCATGPEHILAMRPVVKSQ